MKKTTLVITVLISFPLFSQVPLTTTNNTLRHGDILCKIEVPYLEQGEKGNDAVWRFPAILLDQFLHRNIEPHFFLAQSSITEGAASSTDWKSISPRRFAPLTRKK